MIFRKIRHRLGRYPAIRTLALRTLHRRAYREDVRRRLTPQRRLSYFILNILDHCNLGCAGCDHFAPLAERSCVPVEDIARDLARIAEILRGDVASIGVMGGEPLLHPRLEEILARTRRFLPETDIMLVTNGILLPKMGESFWSACRENDIVIVNTRYPINLDYGAIRQTAAAHGVRFRHYGRTDAVIKTSYRMALDLRGTQDPRQSFRNCFHANTYPLLAQGRLYACTVAPNVRHFNRRFGTGMRLEEGDWLDIHRPVTAAGILEFLSEPRPFCRYCRVSRRSYGHPWRRSSGDFHEWVEPPRRLFGFRRTGSDTAAGIRPRRNPDGACRKDSSRV